MGHVQIYHMGSQIQQHAAGVKWPRNHVKRHSRYVKWPPGLVKPCLPFDLNQLTFDYERVPFDMPSVPFDIKT